MLDLKGKTAFVTGAARGIGKEIALALAKAGANVTVSDVADSVFDTATELETLKVGTLAIKCDVSNQGQVESAKNQALEKFGKIDILVNNAGIYPQKAFMEMTDEDWNKVIRINLYGVFYCTKAFLPKMIERKSGKIINLSSIAGAVVGFPFLVHYSASKAAIAGFTKSLALEVAQSGVNVNSVAPGAIDVGGMQADEAMIAQVIKAIPMGRMGKPLDIANLVVFLASDESRYITGQTIICDGGYTLP
jgi:3-oxoacyl-[acyl-carrier protein] reductase